MKKIIVLIAVLVLISSVSVSAGFFDFLLGEDWDFSITGAVAGVQQEEGGDGGGDSGDSGGSDSGGGDSGDSGGSDGGDPGGSDSGGSDGGDSGGSDGGNSAPIDEGSYDNGGNDNVDDGPAENPNDFPDENYGDEGGDYPDDNYGDEYYEDEYYEDDYYEDDYYEDDYRGDDQFHDYYDEQERSRENCPLVEEINRQTDECLSEGGRPERYYDGTCTYMDCFFDDGPQYRGSEGEFHECPADADLVFFENECTSHGGEAYRIFRPEFGCEVVECGFGEGEFFGGECPNPEDNERQANECTEIGLYPISVPSGPGCPPKIVCTSEVDGHEYGYRYDEYQDGRERFERGEIDNAKLLDIVLKIDTALIRLSGLQEKFEALADYFDQQDDLDKADQYYDASDMIEDAAEELDYIREDLGEIVNGGDVTYEDLFEIRSDIRYTMEGVLGDVVTILLGGSIDYDYDEENAGSLDCGYNDYCFERHFKECTKGATFEPEPGIELRLDGTTENDECIFIIDMPFGEEGRCEVPNYRYAPLEEESILPYCDENMQRNIEQYDNGREGDDHGRDFEDDYREFDDRYEDDYYDDYRDYEYDDFPRDGFEDDYRDFPEGELDFPEEDFPIELEQIIEDVPIEEPIPETVEEGGEVI